MISIDLTHNWHFQRKTENVELTEVIKEDGGWLPASVPGTVHTDLLQANQIADPFWGQNEQDVQWVGDADWLYRCRFDIPEGALKSSQVDLCFDGLDTFATVWLNGQQILVS